MNDAPTIGERYSSAIDSSNLRLTTERTGDVDVMIASGWIEDGMATMLYRLRVEFDSVRAVVRGPDKLSPIERYLILDRMKTLRPAAEHMQNFAIGQALMTGAPVDSKIARLLMGQVLDVFLDPTCHHCEGRGFNGGSHRGEPQIICRPCRGTGHRRDQIGKSDAQRAFAARLLAQMQERIDGVDRLMRAFLRGK